jgi:hypothetical protein
MAKKKMPIVRKHHNSNWNMKYTSTKIAKFRVVMLRNQIIADFPVFSGRLNYIVQCIRLKEYN